VFGRFGRRRARCGRAVFAVGVVMGMTACSGSPSQFVSHAGVPFDVRHTASAGVKVAVSGDGLCSAPAVIAHRGDGGTDAAYPENTSAAELNAARSGATVLDVDVRWTSDDVPVAIHDSTLNRTTNGTGPVTRVTAAQFTGLLSKNNNGTARSDGAHPQTLAQVLAAVSVTNLPMIVQMEADPFNGGDGRASIRALARIVSASGYAANVIVAGWTAEDVLAFEDADHGVRTALLAEEPSDPSAHEVKAAGTNVLYIDYRLVTAARMAAWRKGGVTVWAWTPPFSYQWARLKGLGVDAVATNWVPNYVKWGKPCQLDQPS
jgi:glycerophosphoryl diester phosphodiesterase